MPLKPGPGYWWNAQPSGQWSPVAFGPLSGPLHRRRSNTPICPLASETQTRPCLSMSPPRGPKPGSGTLYCSASDLCGFLVGSIGLPGSVYSSRTPLPLVSITSAVQPCDFSMSPVSSSILVLIQPTLPPPPPVLIHSVSLA